MIDDPVIDTPSSLNSTLTSFPETTKILFSWSAKKTILISRQNNRFVFPTKTARSPFPPKKLVNVYTLQNIITNRCRLAGAPDKLAFLKDGMNIVDVLAIMPYFLSLFILSPDANM